MEKVDPFQQRPNIRSWQCLDPQCGKITDKPFRWAVGAKTTFACDTCQGDVKEIGALESSVTLEEILRKVTLLEQQLIALHQRVTDQCGKL